MAVLRAREPTGVRLVSFERDLDAFQLALANLPSFRHLRHEAPHRLAKYRRFVTDAVEWTLVEGDFLAELATQPRPDVICYDPFSAKVDAPMWSLATFTLLFDFLARDPRPVELFTYSASTAVRSAMLAAGFSVARGVASGPKPETTIALVHMTAPHDLLGRDWLERRARSSAPWAPDVAPERRGALDHAIRSHPQFAGT
jgi:queuine tRNA-ribosyltransferase